MDVYMAMPHERRLLPGHTDESTIGREWEDNPFIRVWRGARAGRHRARHGPGRTRNPDRLEPRLRRQGQGLGALRRRGRRDRRRLQRRPLAPRTVRNRQYRPGVRLIVARCEVTYTGRLFAYLPESTRLLILKADGSVLVHADAGGYKPLNWMTPPIVLEERPG